MSRTVYQVVRSESRGNQKICQERKLTEYVGLGDGCEWRDCLG